MLKAPESQPANGWNKMFLKIGMIANKHVCATKEIKIQVEYMCLVLNRLEACGSQVPAPC